MNGPDPSRPLVVPVGVLNARQPSGRRGGLHPLRLPCLGLVVSMLASGCVLARFGPNLEEFPSAASPHGVAATLVTSWGHVHGELLEVTQAGLLLLETDGVSELRWAQIQSASFSDIQIRWRAGAPPDPRDRDQLRLVSRYVPGLTDEQREQLLRFHGQDAPLRHPRSEPGQAAPYPDGFLEATRVVLDTYRDPEQAGLAGYRPLGPDFPGMGKHWVNPYLVIRAGLDPQRPAVITYLETPDGTIPTGVAFIQVQAPGEAPPDFPLPAAWHVHSGTVDEEVLALNPAVRPHAGEDEPRIAMLHAWTGLENPEGTFAQDNWAVPFARLGLPVPIGAGPSTGKALFLASDGDAYYLKLIRSLGELSPAEQSEVARVLSRSRTQVEGLVASLPPYPSPRDTQILLPQLDQVWRTLWEAIRDEVGPESWRRVGVLGL